MSELVFIGWDKCSTCKKAEKFLKDHNLKYTKRDIMTDNPTEKELTKWIDKSGLPIKRFFNTSGFVYRDMNLKDKLENMSDEKQIKLLASTGRLIRRPILLGDFGVFVGFHKEMYETLL